MATLTSSYQKIKEVDLGNFTGYGKVYLRLYARVSSEGYNIEENKTKVYAKSVLYNSGAWFSSYGSTTASVSCTGLTTQSGKKEQRYEAGETTLFETSGYVTHNNDGTKTITVGGSWVSTPWGINKSTSATADLPKIPRYATANQSLNSKTESSIKMNWSSDSTIDYIWYSTDDGSTWTGRDVTDGTSGSYTIWEKSNDGKSLSANTTYKIKTRVRRKDSQLTTDSSALSVTTYDYPYCTESPNFTIGNSLTLKFYNPLGRDVTVNIIGNGNTIGTWYTTGTSLTGFYASDTVANLYASIPNAKSGTYQVKVTYGNSVKTRNNGNTYSINANNCKPIFSDFDWETNDYSNLTGDSQTIIKGFSSIKTIVSNNNKAVAQKSASIKSYQTIIGTKSKTNSTITYPVETTVNNIDGLTISVFANDSRGLSTKVDKSISNFIDLIPLSINKIEVDRTPNNDEEVILKVEGIIDTVDFGRVVNAINRSRYYYKLKDSNTYIEGTTNLQFTYEKISGTQYKFFINQTIKGDIEDGFSSNGEYDIKVTISDKLTEVTKETSLEQGSPGIALLGNNVALGAPYDEQLGGRVQVNGQNIDNAYIVVNSKKPTDKPKVWIEKSNNLIDIESLDSSAFSNCSRNGKTITQREADTKSTLNWKVQQWSKDWAVLDTTTLTKNDKGIVAITFKKNPNTKYIYFGLNGTTKDTVVAFVIEDWTNDEYTVSANILNTTQGSVSWNNTMIQKGTKFTGFEDYLEPRIHTKNSNGLFEKLDGFQYPNIITAKRTSNMTVTATTDWQNTEIPMESISAQIGNKLSLKNGRIKIGKRISYIKVNGNVQLDRISSTGTIGLFIGVYRQGVFVSPGGIVNYSQPINGGLQNISVSPILTKVQENDELIMHVYIDNNGGSVRVRGGYEGASSLTVEVVK